jgi:hypothetical protein
MYLCTYFDSLYVDKGLVCSHTLKIQNPNSKLFVLCLDNHVYNKTSKLSNVIPIKLSDFEKHFPELMNAKHNRSNIEYYATMSPFFPLYIFEKFSFVDVLFYTDADMAFWSDPVEMLEIVGDKSLMVVDHGFEPPRSGVRFNVGILAYRNDNYCREFLDWWKARCLEWCKWVTLPNGMCADQGYLNIIHDKPSKFRNTLTCPHPGINMGPWNIAKYKITRDGSLLKINNTYNLICYHYHEFKIINMGLYYPTGWKHSKSDRELIYEPYFSLIKRSISGTL